MTADDDEMYKVTLEDIERTKRRQFEITNYSTLASGALIYLVKIFAEDGIDQYPFYNVIIWAVAANGLSAFVFQIVLIAALQRFRERIADSVKRRIPGGASPTRKFWRDTPLFAFLLAFPLAAAGFAGWYAIRMSGIPLASWIGVS